MLLVAFSLVWTPKHWYRTGWVQDNRNNKRNVKQWDALTASHSSYSKFPQREHPRQPGDKRASVSLLLKATSQHSRLQQTQIWQPTGNSCHSRARSIRALSEIGPISCSTQPRACGPMCRNATSNISRRSAALCPWLLRTEGHVLSISTGRTEAEELLKRHIHL